MSWGYGWAWGAGPAPSSDRSSPQQLQPLRLSSHDVTAALLVSLLDL